MRKAFTDLFPDDLTFKRTSRVLKARKIIAVLKDYLGNLSNLTCLDLGCSVGHITRFLGKNFESVVGVDVDDNVIAKAKTINTAKNVSFKLSGENKIPFPDGLFDAVVFNQIYEHVKTPKKLVTEIMRVLRKGGVCYFGVRNKLFFMDGHYPIPFLGIMPKKIADFIVRVFYGKDEYDVRLYSLAELRNLVKDFGVVDYTLKVFENPKKYFLKGSFKLLWPFAKGFYILIPNYIWILVKN